MSLYIWLPALYFPSDLIFVHNQPLNSVTTHLRYGKRVRILSQLRESDLPVGDASRTLPSSNDLLEVLPIYQLSVDYIGCKVYSVSWGRLTFPSVMRTERCTQAVTYLRCYQYTNYQLTILGVKYTQSAEGDWPSRRWCEPNAVLKQWPTWAATNIPTSVDYIGSKGTCEYATE